MLFNSLDFIVFLIVVIGLTFSVPIKYRALVLLFSSYFLYSLWSIISLISILYCSITNFYFGILIGNQNEVGKRKKLLYIAIILSLVPLLFYKFNHLFFSILNLTLDSSLTINPLGILIPIGISFYTLQNMSYTIDVYSKKITHENSLVDYLTFATFFPIQVVGPIERADNLLKQLKSKIVFNLENTFIGIKLMLWGFFKKIVIADSLAVFVEPVFNNPTDHHPLTLLYGVILFAFQLYADFSGYIDIARGIAKIFNITLLNNFNIPYSSQSMKEFWRRWHITLTRWLTDYIYIPLGGNKSNLFSWIRNVFIVFIISGIWHGLSVNYFIWGTLHACYYILGMKTLSFRDSFYYKYFNHKIVAIFKTIVNFILVTFAWIFFRANTFQDAITIIKKIFFQLMRIFYSEPIIENIQLLKKELFTTQNLLNIMLLILFVSLDQHKIIDRFSSSEAFDKPKIVDLIILDILILLLLLLGSSNTRDIIYMNY